MRLLVRQVLDDAIEGDDGTTDDDEHRYKLTELDFALEAALEGVLALVGPKVTRYDVQTEVTTSSGSADLSALKAIEIKGVEHKSGNVYVPLSAGSHGAPMVTGFDATLRITYVGLPTFPAASGDAMTYGSGASVASKSFDRLVAIRAALDLAPKDNERKPVLEGQEARALEQVLQIGRTPGAREIRFVSPSFGFSEHTYLSGYAHGYRWVWVPSTQALNLVV